MMLSLATASDPSMASRSPHDDPSRVSPQATAEHKHARRSRSNRVANAAFTVQLNESQLLAETNATLLTAYYRERQERYGFTLPAMHRTWRGVLDVASEPADSVKLLNGTHITVWEAAEAFELMMSPLGGQQRTVGEGSIWHGVDTLINPIDAAVFSALLWEHQPELLVEIGTECGGSALFFASIMRSYSKTARVLTYDVAPTWRRCSNVHDRLQRRAWKGYKSPLWLAYVKEGSIMPRTGDVSAPSELALIDQMARAAVSTTAARFSTSAPTQSLPGRGGVWVFDDGDHTTTPLLVHFHLLARHVSAGGLYIVADTRLEYTCLAGKRVRYNTAYCRDIRGSIGGPARAVKYLQKESAIFRDLGFEVDRSVERYTLTQHPGGFLRRRACSGASCNVPKGARLAASEAWQQPWTLMPPDRNESQVLRMKARL